MNQNLPLKKYESSKKILNQWEYQSSPTYKSLAVVVCSGVSLDPLTISCANLTCDLCALLLAACLAKTELGPFPSKECGAKF